MIALGSYCGSAWAVLPIDLDAGLKALGSVDLDGRTGPGAPASQLIDRVEVPPAFARSSVGVADALPGVFSYAASSDVGTLALRLDGTISNTTTNAYFGQSTPMLAGLRCPYCTSESTKTRRRRIGRRVLTPSRAAPAGRPK